MLIISKGEIGNSGNLLLAGGGFSLDGYSARHELDMTRMILLLKMIFLIALSKKAFI